MNVLGAIADDFANAETTDDPRAAYVAWSDAVKRAGGAIANAPHKTAELVYDIMSGAVIGGGEALVAARYPLRTVFPNAPSATLAPLFHKQPDDWSNDGSYVYYIAPPAVQAYAGAIGDGTPSGGTYPSGGITDAQRVPGEPPPPAPKWYDDLKRYARYAGYGAGALLVLELLRTIRPNPPARARRRRRR